MKIKMEEVAWQEGRKKDGREGERRDKGRRWREERGVDVNCPFSRYGPTTTISRRMSKRALRMSGHFVRARQYKRNFSVLQLKQLLLG